MKISFLCILTKSKMLTLARFFYLFSLFGIIENRICLGVTGKVCCEGFAINSTSGRCEKCPIGYYRYNCSEKCSPPTYGEECQLICHCPYDECHFVFGCLQNVGTETDHQTQSSTRGVTSEHAIIYSTVKVSALSIINVTGFYNFSTDKNQYFGTTLINLSPNFDLFKNSFIVKTIISIVGIFVLLFAIFVFAYIYKCFQKTTFAGGMKESNWKTQYKSLNFEAVKPECSLSQEPQEHDNVDSTYLSPVFSRTGSSETRSLDEIARLQKNEILPENLFDRQSIFLETQDETNDTQTNVQTPVYIEITEENTF